MNWFIYIGGWYLTAILEDAFFQLLTKNKNSDSYWARLIAWTLIWIYICWRFIK